MGSPILVLGETKHRIIRMEVLEGDVYKVHLGQTARITSEAYPGRVWLGKVTRVAPVMGKKILSTESPKEKTDVKILEVHITPDEPLDLPINLPIEAKIHETIRQGVLVVPARALDSNHYVRLSNGKAHPIQIGARDDAYVEVVAGLSEGDKVLLPK